LTPPSIRPVIRKSERGALADDPSVRIELGHYPICLVVAGFAALVLLLAERNPPAD